MWWQRCLSLLCWVLVLEAAQIDIVARENIQLADGTQVEDVTVRITDDGTDTLTYNVTLAVLPTGVSTANQSAAILIQIFGHIPYMTMNTKLMGYVPSHMMPIVAKATLVDNFTSQISQDDVKDQLASLYQASVTPNGISSQQLPTFHGEDLNTTQSQHILQRPTQHLRDHHQRLMAQHGTVNPARSREYRHKVGLQVVPQDPPNDTTELYASLAAYVNLTAYNGAFIAQACTDTASNPVDYAAALTDFCSPENGYALGNEVKNCILKNSCILHLECGGNVVCAYNHLTELEANVAVQARAAQTSQIGFYRVFATTAIDSNKAMVSVLNDINASLAIINASSSSELSALDAQYALTDNFLTMNMQLNDTVARQGQLLKDVANITTVSFAQETERYLGILTEIQALTSLTTSLRNQLSTMINTVVDQSQIAQAQLISLIQVSQLSSSIWQSMAGIIDEVSLRRQSRRLLVKNMQLASIYATQAGLVPLGTSMGVAPASLTAAEIYRILGAFSFWRLQNVTSSNATLERVTWTIRCNTAFLAFDLTPRNTLFDPANWIGPPGCGLSNGEADATAAFPCKCFIRELRQNSTSPLVYDFLLGDFVQHQTPAENYSFSFNTIDQTRFQAYDYINVTARPEDNGTVTDTYLPGTPLGVGTYDQSGLYRVVSTTDFYTSTAFQDAIQGLCLDSHIPNAADAIDAWVGAAPPGETPTEHALRRGNGVWIRAHAYGCNTYQAILDATVSDRSYCVANPALMSQWYNVTTIQRQGNALPFFVYRSMLDMMGGFEAVIDEVGILMEGKMFAPIVGESTRAKYSPGSIFSATTHTVNFTAAAQADATNSFTTYEDRVYAAAQSADQEEVWQYFNPQWITDVNVQFPGSSASSVLRSQTKNIRWSVIPTRATVVGYPACYWQPCPKRVMVLDPTSEVVFAVSNDEGASNETILQVGNNDTQQTGFPGMRAFGYDIPEEMTGFQRENTPFYLMERQDESLSSFNSDPELRGPFYRRPSRPFLGIVQGFQNGPMYDPRATNVPATVYRVMMQSPTNFSNAYDFQCATNDRPTASPSAFLCRTLDLFYLQVNATRHRVEITPRPGTGWVVETTVRVPAGTVLSSPGIIANPGLWGSLACPSQISFAPRQSDVVAVNLVNFPTSGLYGAPVTGLLGGGVIQILIASSGCPQDPIAKTSLGLPASTVVVTHLLNFQGWSTGIPGCAGQVLTVSVVNTSSQASLRCASNRPYPTPISFSGIKTSVIQESSVVVDRLAGVLANLASKVQAAVQMMEDSSIEALAQSLGGQVIDLSSLDQAAANVQSLMDDATQAILDSNLFNDQLVNQVNANIDSLSHLIGNQSFQDQFNASVTLILDQALLYAERLSLLLPVLASSLNSTQTYITGLSDLNLMFPGAGSNTSFAAMTDPMLALYQGLDCQAELEAAGKARAQEDTEYYHSLECSGIMCIRGPYVGYRYLILSVPAAVVALGASLISGHFAYTTTGATPGAKVPGQSPYIGLAVGYVFCVLVSALTEVD